MHEEEKALVLLPDIPISYRAAGFYPELATLARSLPMNSKPYGQRRE